MVAPTGDAIEGFTPTWPLSHVVLMVQVTHTNTALLPTRRLWENISGAACMGQDSSLALMQLSHRLNAILWTVQLQEVSMSFYQNLLFPVSSSTMLSFSKIQKKYDVCGMDP